MGRLNEKRRCAINHLSRAGLNQSEIARRLGCSRQNIHGIVSYNPRPKKEDSEQFRRVDKLMESGMCLREIAEEMGCSQQRIQVIVRQLGWKKIWVK